MKKTLENIHIAVPESRQLDVLANLFLQRSATVTRCPLVSIYDSPDTQAIEQWLREFIDNTPDYLVILTGEGIRRLTGFAERAGWLDDWAAALERCYLLARGPKPNRALRELKLQANELAVAPTSDGMMASLQKKIDAGELRGKRLAVQLYGQDPNEKLQDFLRKHQLDYHTVSPYIYADDTKTEAVQALIGQLSKKELDLICFTSKAQYQRLKKVAISYGLEEELKTGLIDTKIAAVGPVVADQLKEQGFSISVMPDEKFFMKPMVSAIEKLFAQQSR